jgi:hypothetical protein
MKGWMMEGEMAEGRGERRKEPRLPPPMKAKGKGVFGGKKSKP